LCSFVAGQEYHVLALLVSAVADPALYHQVGLLEVHLSVSVAAGHSDPPFVYQEDHWF